MPNKTFDQLEEARLRLLEAMHDCPRGCQSPVFYSRQTPRPLETLDDSGSPKAYMDLVASVSGAISLCTGECPLHHQALDLLTDAADYIKSV